MSDIAMSDPESTSELIGKLNLINVVVSEERNKRCSKAPIIWVLSSAATEVATSNRHNRVRKYLLIAQLHYFLSVMHQESTYWECCSQP